MYFHNFSAPATEAECVFTSCDRPFREGKGMDTFSRWALKVCSKVHALANPLVIYNHVIDHIYGSHVEGRGNWDGVCRWLLPE